MDVFDGLSNQDYAEGIATLIDPVDITLLSRISKNRICFFLRTKVIADNLTEIHKQVIIKGKTTPKCPLITKTVRVIISNASADIPNGIIKDELVKQGVNLLSEITDIKADLTGPMYAHILSFQKQVFIKPEDEEKINSIQCLRIRLNNVDHMIFVSTEKMVRFLCHIEGHLARQCGKNKEKDPLSQVSTGSTSLEPLAVTRIRDDNQIMLPPKQSTAKRGYSSSTVSSIESPVTKQIQKKFKRNVLCQTFQSSKPN
ncbi:hypothetical protein HHI36_023979 [Cryptolaemus montrouzieri]|uniref:Gag-like protein n=1 Tax=Cryptolaemus montrouzieri TaxID=559131 RepID=A0ABD2NIZ1_9CUCU